MGRDKRRIHEAALTMATNDTISVRNKVAIERAKAKGGRLVLAPGTYFIESGSVYLAPGYVLIACEPPGLCSIQVPAGAGASWAVAPQKEWDDATVSKLS